MSSPTADFGHGMRELFSFAENWRNLNHGSYGTYPRSVGEFKRDLTAKVESAPDVFMRYDYAKYLDESRRRLAELVKVPTDECVLVQNATLGVNVALRNLVYKEKDVILHFETIYPSIESCLVSLQESFPQLGLRKVGYGCSTEFRLPMSHDDICKLFAESILQIQKEGLTVKAAVFDTIISLPGARLPFERLTKICKDHGILSVIDGAHAIGQIPLDLAELDADFFVSNCHKWLYVPRGCALFHVPKRNQHLIRTTFPTGFGFVPIAKESNQAALPGSNSSRFINIFQFVATADNTPHCCISAALDFRDQVCGGEQAIYDYNIRLAQSGAEAIAAELGTEVMGEKLAENANSQTGKNPSGSSKYTGIRACSLANILLPLFIDYGPNLTDGSSASGSIPVQEVPRVVDWMQRTLVKDHHTSLSIFAYDSKLWIRVSGQIYLELSDYQWLADCLKSVCKRVKAGEAYQTAPQEF